jgi:uncharacterized membrane protein
MSDPIDSTTPPAVPASTPEAASGGWTTTNTGHAQVPPGGYSQNYGTPPPGGFAQPAAGSGLSDSAAGAIAYITIIPAIIFLVIDPYKNKPFVKFHCFQSLGLAVAWIAVWIVTAMIAMVLAFIPIIHFFALLLYPLVGLSFLLLWLLCVLKAAQGGSFKLPLIGDFAAKQSGYIA